MGVYSDLTGRETLDLLARLDLIGGSGVPPTTSRPLGDARQRPSPEAA